jgi:hypothetical protein
MTDLITLPRATVQQALEALENSSPDQYPEDAGVFYDAKDALKAALEQPVQEPVAWACFKNGELQTELVGTEADVDFWCASDEPEMQGMVKGALYTHPPSRETEPAAFDALVAISLLTHLGGEVADYEDVVEAVRRLHALNGELLKTLKWLDRWLGGKPMTECSSRILEAIAKAEGA